MNSVLDDLRDLARSFLAAHAVRSREPGAFDQALWRRLAGELGLLGLALPPADGGGGAGWVELGVVLEETGRSLLALPYLSTVVCAALLPSSLRRGVADGLTVAALALDAPLVVRDGLVSGVAERVMDGDVATLAVVAARTDRGPALFAVPLSTVSREVTQMLDLSRPAATLRLSGVPATPLSASPEEASDLLHLALAAESLGVAAASLERAVTHLRTRQQFGVPLASFQALRHRVADLAVAIEAATSTTWYALQAPLAERPVVAPMAKLVAADAAYTVTAESIQLHGGIGFTWEHDAHRYFKRATATRLDHGDPLALRRQLAARAGLW